MNIKNRDVFFWSKEVLSFHGLVFNYIELGKTVLMKNGAIDYFESNTGGLFVPTCLRIKDSQLNELLEQHFANIILGAAEILRSNPRYKKYILGYNRHKKEAIGCEKTSKRYYNRARLSLAWDWILKKIGELGK
jgi:hypothetical protein